MVNQMRFLWRSAKGQNQRVARSAGLLNCCGPFGTKIAITYFCIQVPLELATFLPSYSAPWLFCPYLVFSSPRNLKFCALNLRNLLCHCHHVPASRSLVPASPQQRWCLGIKRRSSGLDVEDLGVGPWVNDADVCLPLVASSWDNHAFFPSQEFVIAGVGYWALEYLD